MNDKVREDEREERFAAAFERRESERIASEIRLAFRKAGLKAATDAEADRVKKILQRDREYRLREDDRQLAELEVREGVYVNLADAVVEPTPEWLEKAETSTFVPRQPKETVRSIRTVRRVVNPIVTRLWRAGKIDSDQHKACLWYRYMHEKAGMEGRYSSSRAETQVQNIKARTQGGTGGHIPITLEEAAARQAFRRAREKIPAPYLRFFEAIVLHDVAIYKAYRFARCSRPRAIKRFQRLSDKVLDFCEQYDFNLNTLERG